MLSLSFAAAALAFAPGMHPQLHTTVTSNRPAVVMMAKGFGKPSTAEVKAAEKAARAKAKPKSEASTKRDKAARDFDALKNSGSPEYMVLVRECPEGQEPGKWYPVGGI